MDLFDFCAFQCQVYFVSCFWAELRPKRKCFSVVRFSHDAALQRSFLRMLCLYLLLPQLWPLTSNMHTHSLIDTGTQLFLWRYLDSTCQWKHGSLLLSLPHRVSTEFPQPWPSFPRSAECLHWPGRLHCTLQQCAHFHGAMTWFCILSPLFPLSPVNYSCKTRTCLKNTLPK